MRICYFADAGNVHTQRWVKYFADNGHEVHLISFRSFGDNDIKNVKLHLIKRLTPQIRIIFSPIDLLFIVIQVKTLIKKIKPDILHSHFVSDYGCLGSLSGFRPFIVTAWGSDVLIAPRRSRILRWRVKYALKMADLVTCDAEHIKEPLIELGAEPQKINLIYFGVDTRKFNPRQKSEKIRKELGIFNSPIVISLRHLEPLYDIESLILSISLVLREVPEAKFVIAGEGSQEKKLKQLAESLGVSDSVRFIAWIPNEELPQYLLSADIYVSTSLSDAGLAASTAEAMACGLPVIITDFGDNRKWVKDRVNGFIIPLRAPEALASKIIHLLQNKDERKNFGKVNRQIIEEKNNWEKEMGKMGKLYEELIEKCKK